MKIRSTRIKREFKLKMDGEIWIIANRTVLNKCSIRLWIAFGVCLCVECFRCLHITWLKQRHCWRSFVFVYVVCWLYLFLWFSSIQLICIIDPCINAIFVFGIPFYIRSSFRVIFLFNFARLYSLYFGILIVSVYFLLRYKTKLLSI